MNGIEIQIEEMKFSVYMLIIAGIILVLCVSIASETIYKVNKLEYQDTGLTYCYDFQKTNQCRDNLYFRDNGEVNCIKDDYEVHKIGTWK